MCLSPGPSSVDGEDTYPSAFDRVSVAHQGQSLSHYSLQTDVSCLPQTQQTRDYLLLQPARESYWGRLQCTKMNPDMADGWTQTYSDCHPSGLRKLQQVEVQFLHPADGDLHISDSLKTLDQCSGSVIHTNTCYNLQTHRTVAFNP